MTFSAARSGTELFEYVKPLRSIDMKPTRNNLGQPIGFPLPGWAPPPVPPREPMQGRWELPVRVTQLLRTAQRSSPPPEAPKLCTMILLPLAKAVV